jgi:hypothetical protein
MNPDDPWALMEFVHETKHLEQGFYTALSVYGEMEAWQIGFEFYYALLGRKPSSLSPIGSLLKLPLSHNHDVLMQAAHLIDEDQNTGKWFWNRDYYWIYALPLNPLNYRSSKPWYTRGGRGGK